MRANVCVPDPIPGFDGLVSQTIQPADGRMKLETMVGSAHRRAGEARDLHRHAPALTER